MHSFPLSLQGTVSAHSLLVLDTFSRVLSFSPSLAAVVNEKSPEAVKAGFFLHKFILHPTRSFSAIAVGVVFKLIITCPQFSDWRTFVVDEGSVSAILGPQVAAAVPAKVLPDFEVLGKRLQEHIQTKFGSSRVRKAARPMAL